MRVGKLSQPAGMVSEFTNLQHVVGGERMEIRGITHFTTASGSEMNLNKIKIGSAMTKSGYKGEIPPSSALDSNKQPTMADIDYQ